MDRGISARQTPAAGDFPAEPGPGAQPCPGTETASGPVLRLGEELVRTLRHFWPEFNAWLERVPDSRCAPFITYDKRFLIWWGISLYLFQLGSRRQLDFERDARGTQVLGNLNRLAQTAQETRPVHKTLPHFLGHTGAAPDAR